MKCGKIASDTLIYEFVDEIPTFPGGQEKYNLFIKENLQYSNDANVYGTMYVSFVVEKDGTLTNIKILKGLDKDLSVETIRVFSLMPKWNPGKINGKTVKTRVTQSVKIKPN